MLYMQSFLIRNVGRFNVERVCQITCEKDSDCDIGIGEKVR